MENSCSFNQHFLITDKIEPLVIRLLAIQKLSIVNCQFKSDAHFQCVTYLLFIDLCVTYITHIKLLCRLCVLQTTLSQELSSVNRKVLLNVKMVTHSVNRYCLSDVLELACIGLLELMAKFSGLFQVSSLVT